ncbi:hypothetical protein Q9L42_008880 [Methylomarinum sp. Ch1-1]|uniref:Lipoprotein n=1 Tax=Methylomarinum roseum TaxID=3067653 RepID=A0AAU7NYU1_9GAMM|nr:hypothetical protein [Methylomarinum sp. Ch1-1]MDP4521653.1 hypothetical protein [Methylomarinum sp. Ch1-1]
MKNKLIKLLRLGLVFCLLSTMTGCFYWWRAYQTYLQMDEFDEHFAISVKDDFTVHFKDPILFSEDFVSLAKLHPSATETTGDGSLWRYRFRKVDEQGSIMRPEIKFSFALVFNRENRIVAWIFSPLFLQIAPPEFLELSFRSLGGAEINQGKRQLKVDTEHVQKIKADLPLKSVVVAQLGEPLEIEDQGEQEVYRYHFKLEAYDVEEGYEDRTLSEVKLTFDKQSQALVKMSGRFAGLKISINYRKYQQHRDDVGKSV